MVKIMKTYAIIENGKVANIILADSEFAASVSGIESTSANIGDLWDGETFSKPTLVKSPQELQSEIVQQVQLRLDTFAQTKNYDSILSASTYATSAIPKFKSEGQTAVNSRDSTWDTLYTILGEVQSGTRPMPGGYAEIEPELPVLTW